MEKMHDNSLTKIPSSDAALCEVLKPALLKRLGRIEGQVRGIARMINDSCYCDDILHQVSSMESAINGFKTVLLESHLRGCVIGRIKKDEDAVLEDLLVTLRKFLK